MLVGYQSIMNKNLILRRHIQTLIKSDQHWQIQRGVSGRHAPSRSILMQFSGKKLQNNRLTHQPSRPHLWEILNSSLMSVCNMYTVFLIIVDLLKSQQSFRWNQTWAYLLLKLLNFLDCSPVTWLSPVPVDLTDVLGSEGSDPVSVVSLQCRRVNPGSVSVHCRLPD